MLLGYKKETGEIEFIFTDESYLEKRFPNNSVTVSDFWNNEHKLTEFFISIKEFPFYNNYKLYKIVNGQIIKKSNEEIQLDLDKIKSKKESKIISNPNGSFLSVEQIKSLEDKLKEVNGEKMI
jgi:hypothetical protein